VFTDADWMGDPLTRRLTSGYVMLGAYGLLSCGSKCQSAVATSIMQFEKRMYILRVTGHDIVSGLTGQVGLELSRSHHNSWIVNECSEYI